MKDPGLSFVVSGLWFLVYGFWFVVSGLWFLVFVLCNLRNLWIDL
jgi:hypothetical protein